MHLNEDVAWERLKDRQREAENSRLWADGSADLLQGAAQLARRAWIVAGVAMRRPPRRGTAGRGPAECETA